MRRDDPLMTDAALLEFTFEGKPVGHFQEPCYPTGPGRYRYMPYRSLGHYEMGAALGRGGRPICTFSNGGRLVSFSVVARPAYGEIQLDDFRAAASPAAPPG